MTSRFAEGERNAAFAKGAAPFTLIDSDKTGRPLVEPGIGARQRTTEPPEMNAETFVTGVMDNREQRRVR